MPTYELLPLNRSVLSVLPRSVAEHMNTINYSLTPVISKSYLVSAYKPPYGNL